MAPKLPPGWAESLIRTWIPIAIGAALTWANSHYAHLGIPDHATPDQIIAATAIATAAWYALARAVEHRWPELGGWLVSLGIVQSQPSYGESRRHIGRASVDGGEGGN